MSSPGPAAGEFRVALLSGEAGVGKSRLGRELLARHPETAGMFARAHPLGVTAAFGVWAEAIDPLLQGRSDGQVMAACGGLLDDLASLFHRVAVIRGSLILTFFAASRVFDPFFGRRLPPLAAAAGLADARCEVIACHRPGGSAAAELLRRSLKRTHGAVLRDGAVDAGEFEAVLAATRDPSFSFVDALSVAAWGRVAGLRHRAAASPPGNPG
jgi:hypothetical protein